MMRLRDFTKNDAICLQKEKYVDVSVEEIEHIINEWNQKQANGRYFEMYAIVSEQNVVGTISLYQQSENVISIGPEIFGSYRRKGYAKQAMLLACEVVKEKGYQIVLQQVKVDNIASIALHEALEFETNKQVYINSKGNSVLFYLKNLK